MEDPEKSPQYIISFKIHYSKNIATTTTTTDLKVSVSWKICGLVLSLPTWTNLNKMGNNPFLLIRLKRKKKEKEER